MEHKLRIVFANPSFVRSRSRKNFGDARVSRLLPFKSINSLGDPQQHLLQALAASMSLLGLQMPLSDNFARWCDGNGSDYDLEAASSALKQLLVHLRLSKRHVNAIYADSRALSQLIQRYGVLDDPTFVSDDVDGDAVATPAHEVARANTGDTFRSLGSTWELRVMKIYIVKANGKYKSTSLNLNFHDGFFSPRLRPHSNSDVDGWYIRARLSVDHDDSSLDYWFSPVFKKSLQVTLTPNFSFIEELGALASGSDQDVIDYLQLCILKIEIWRHKPKREDFPMYTCSSFLKHQSLGLAAATLSLQPDARVAYGNSGKASADLQSDFSVSGTVELVITRRRAAEPSKIIFDAEVTRAVQSSEDPLLSDSAPAPDALDYGTTKLRTELDDEVSVLRNWTFMGAAAALLIQHNASSAAVKTIMLLYCFASGLAVVHARDCCIIARALNMKCDNSSLVNALELLLQLDSKEEPRSYSATDVYSLVDTTRIALRTGAVDLIVMAARHYLDNIMLYPHVLQRDCVPVLLKISSRKSSFDDGHLDSSDSLIFQLQSAIRSWNTFTAQSIRSLQVVSEAAGDRMQRLLTVSTMFRMVSDELDFQLAEVAPLYPPEVRPKQTIARNLCSQVVQYTQAFIIEGSDDETFDADLLIQVFSHELFFILNCHILLGQCLEKSQFKHKSLFFSLFFQLFEALLRVIELLKGHACSNEAESMSQLFQEMFPMWLSSIEIGITRQLESALAADDMSSLTGIHPTPLDIENGGSQTIGVIDSLFELSDVLLDIPSLDADLHQSFWNVILRVGHHAASAVKSAILRDIQYVLIVEGAMSDSEADACIEACVLPLSPAQFLNELDASREGIGGSYTANTSWGRVVSSLCYPIHFLTPAILHRAGIAHSIARRVHDFATYELNKSDDPMIALLPHASLISLLRRFLDIFDQAFHMACNTLTIFSLQLIEHTLAQEDIYIQGVVDEICRTCEDMLDCFRHAMLSDASSSACSLVLIAVCKACVMAALQMKHGDVDGISFLDAIQVKLMVSLNEIMSDCKLFDKQLERENRYNYSIYVDLFKCLTRRGIEGDVGVLLMSTQDLIFEYTKMRNGKVGKSELGIRDLQAVLVRRAKSGDMKASEFLQSYVEEPSNWRIKFDVLDSEASFMVASCRMRHVNAQMRKQGGVSSNDSWIRGSFILTKFHCAFIQDDAEDNSSSICFVLAHLNQFVSNHRNSTITLDGLPKSRKIMFYIRIHIIEVAGVTEEVAIQLALCGQSWSSAPLRLAKSTSARALDSGSPWVESRLVCKDLSESMYPSKCQLSESPPLAVDTVPSSLVVQLSTRSHVLGQGMLSVDEVSPLVVNDFVIKVKLASGSIADIRVFVTVVPASSAQQLAQQDVRIELGDSIEPKKSPIDLLLI